MEDIIKLLKQILDDIECLRQAVTGTAQEQFLGMKEAAIFLGISLSAMQKISAERIIPSTKPSGKVYFKKTDLVRYMETGRQKSVGEMQEEQLRILQKAAKDGSLNRNEQTILLNQKNVSND